jgi:hypothetical protein
MSFLRRGRVGLFGMVARDPINSLSPTMVLSLLAHAAIDQENSTQRDQSTGDLMGL